MEVMIPDVLFDSIAKQIVFIDEGLVQNLSEMKVI